jgi:hypothetical protein
MRNVAAFYHDSCWGFVYCHRHPELGTPHRVVREKILTLHAATEEGFAGIPLPQFVRQEFAAYLDCSLPC